MASNLEVAPRDLASPVSEPPIATGPAPLQGRSGSAGPTPAKRQRTGSFARSPLLLLVSAVIALAVLGSVGWRLSGGSMFSIATPSMCPDLCVGTLVLDRPLDGALIPGMLVTFRPPGTNTVYTHRVVRVLPDGQFKTAGDALNKIDPWTVPKDRVIGRVVAHFPGLGWFWRCLFALSVALACFIWARRFIRTNIRLQFDLLAVTSLIVIPVLVTRPFLRAQLIWRHARAGGRVIMQVVNTGLLPAQFQITGAAPHGPIAPGHLVTLSAFRPDGRALALREEVSFSAWQWLTIVVIIGSPVAILLAQLLWRRIRARRAVAGVSNETFALHRANGPVTKGPVGPKFPTTVNHDDAATTALGVDRDSPRRSGHLFGLAKPKSARSTGDHLAPRT